MKKPAIIAIVLTLVLLIAMLIFFLSRPNGPSSFSYVSLLEDCLDREQLSMELQVQAKLPSRNLTLSAHIQRDIWQEQRITAISSGGHTLFYTKGVVLTEHGNAYRLSDAYPDYSKLLQIARELYQNAQVEVRENTCSITVTGEAAQQIRALVLPGIDADIDELTAQLVAEGKQLKELCFTGAFVQESRRCTFTASLRILEEDAPIALPEGVQQAIRSGKLEAAQDLSEDLLRLMAAWKPLSGNDPLGAELKLSAQSSLLKLDSNLRLYRRGKISAIEKFGLMLYYNDRTVCDKNGNRILSSDASAVEAGKLLDLAWELATQSQIQVRHDGDLHTYTLSLDRAAMVAVTQAISPQTDPSDMTFQTGTVTLTLQGERLQRVRFQIAGEWKLLTQRAPITLSAEFTMLEDVRFQIPQAVQAALGS